MKKINTQLLIIVLTFILIAFNNCSKDESTPSTPTPVPSIGAVPSTFTQKVMVEENTGAWCGWCVLGADAIRIADETFPGRINAVALHGGSATEPMYIPAFDAFSAFYGVNTVPHYQLQRASAGGFIPLNVFTSSVTTALAMVAECGLAIDAKKSSGNNVSFMVHAGFKSNLTGDYRLMVYLVEDSVINSDETYDQLNYVSENKGYPDNYYYNLPQVIKNYAHKHVARALLSASVTGGDQILPDSVKAGKEYIKTYTFTIPSASGWKSSNLRVVAGILKYDSKITNQFMKNSQSVKLGSLKNWD